MLATPPKGTTRAVLFRRTHHNTEMNGAAGLEANVEKADASVITARVFMFIAAVGYSCCNHEPTCVQHKKKPQTVCFHGNNNSSKTFEDSRKHLRGSEPERD